MTVAFHGKRVMISTGKFVDLNWWDHEKQQVNEAYPDARLINVWLESLAYTAGIIWRSLASLSEKPGAEEGYPMRFDRMNDVFLDAFSTFQSEKGMSDVTVQKMVNTLVWFLNWATRQGYNVYHDYRRFYRLLGSTARPVPPRPLYLEWQELMKFRNYRTDVPRKERICDLFCLMCFTGIRFSELGHLQKGDTGEHNIFIRGRGKKDRVVPLNKYAQHILNKYRDRYYRDNLALPPASAVTVNKYLSVIGKELGLYRRVRDPHEGVEGRPLFEMLTAGVAVQTFIMNALRLEVPPEVIAGLTGVQNDQRIALLRQEIANEEIKKFNDI